MTTGNRRERKLPVQQLSILGEWETQESQWVQMIGIGVCGGGGMA